MKATRVDGLPLLSGPRRFWIGDLMAAVALAALGMTLAVLVDRSDMSPGERTAFAVIAALAFLMLYCQWPLSSLRRRHALLAIGAPGLGLDVSCPDHDDLRGTSLDRPGRGCGAGHHHDAERGHLPHDVGLKRHCGGAGERVPTCD